MARDRGEVMEPRVEIGNILKEYKAILQRDGKHLMWLLPNGNKFTQAKTPSDSRADLNSLSDLRKALGIFDPERGLAGPRRERKAKPGRQAVARPIAPVSTVMADQLMKTGIVEEGLRKKISELEGGMRELHAALAEERSIIFDLRAEIDGMWWNRLKRWWRKES
jgi:hypothetical protein